MALISDAGSKRTLARTVEDKFLPNPSQEVETFSPSSINSDADSSGRANLKKSKTDLNTLSVPYYHQLKGKSMVNHDRNKFMLH